MWHGNEVEKVHELDEWDWIASGQYACVLCLPIMLCLDADTEITGTMHGRAWL
jgi:hypothetical protein